MRKLEIPYIAVSGVPSPEDIIPYLDQLVAMPIANNPWPKYKNDVKAKYTIAHNGNAIFLKFNIIEQYVLASSATNGDIHKDSCVEFFIGFEEDENYYNLEFNSLGWGKIGYGTERLNRILLPESTIDLVSSSSKINSKSVNGSKLFDWSIALVIPASVFYFNNFHTLKGLKARGNFYKCGDEIPSPHFLTWNMIETAEPDFHTNEFFGKIEFS